MESGINADQNFYSRRPLPQTYDQQQQKQHQHQHQQYLQEEDYHQQPHRSPPALPDSNSTYPLRSPELPPKLPFLTTANLQAATSNGFAGEVSGAGDPDAFYRGYRGVQPSNSYNDNTADTMAGSASDLAGGTRPTPSSLRSNSNGLTPKHPPLAGIRQNLKPTIRSVSAPINNDRPGSGGAKSTTALNGGAGKVNVKDMLKRFDQNNEQASTVRKPAPKLVTSQSSTGGAGYMKDRAAYQNRNTGTNQTPSSSRAGVITRDGGPSRVKSPTEARTTQRARFATEDQQSNNALSTAARTTRPRNAASGNTFQASKSMTNLSPTSPPSQPQIPKRRPLFGEVLPDQQILPNIEYGTVLNIATRRTSDSSLNPSWSHSRSKSNQEASPSSPTAWYRGGADLEDVELNKPRAKTGHNRNYSDFTDTKVNILDDIKPSFQQPTPPARSSSAQPRPPPKLTTRLPVMRKAPSSSSSPASTRSSSPFTASKPVSSVKIRKPETPQWSAAGHSATPVNRIMSPVARTTTPTHHTSRTKPQSPDKGAQSKSSLKAYISSSPPKSSPPLRSSRPRQPVSSATTASTRQKASERSGSPQTVRTGMKITRNASVDESKSRKISDAPINFADRRMTIQRAYTNRMQENEQRKTRADNLRRLEERKARDAAEKEESRAQELRAQAEAEVNIVPEPPTRPSTAQPPQSPHALHITTSFASPSRAGAIMGAATGINTDSPTLGLPGSFVDDEEVPSSAISNATGITDIDNEPQTEPAQERLEATFSPVGSRPMSGIPIEWDMLSAEQASFGIDNSFDERDGTIQMILKSDLVQEPAQESTPTKELFGGEPSPRDPSPPGAFKRDSDIVRERPVFATTVTMASPKDTLQPRLPVTGTHVGLSDDRQTSGHFSHMPGGFDNDQDTSQVHPPPTPASYTEYEQSISSETTLAQNSEPSSLAIVPPSLNYVRDYLHTPTTEMDYDSSDGYGGPNVNEAEAAYGQSVEQNPYGDTQGSSQRFRHSQQSTWTDLSVDTGDDSSEQGEYLRHEDTTRHNGSSPFSMATSPNPPVEYDDSSPEPSPLLISDSTPRLASPSRHQLPPLSTGDGFGSALISQYHPNSTPHWPGYSPPPIPTGHPPLAPSTPLSSQRPPSSIDQLSQNGTSRNAESRRASEDVYSPRPSTSTPRSSTQISLEDITPSQSTSTKNEPEDPAAAEETKKRLTKRRHVIKEMIDTEAVYLKDMNVVVEIYKGTAEACPKLDANDVRAIFRNSHEIVAFSTMFLEELKAAASSIYSPRSKSRQSKALNSTTVASSAPEDRSSVALILADLTDEQKDAKTFIGANFGKHLVQMQDVFTDFLKNSEVASERLAALQADPAVKVWLSECNLVAKDLTAAWDLDALLVKPVQRITRYQLLLKDILETTLDTHPDFDALTITVKDLGDIVQRINDLKARLTLVTQIVGRKRKESDVRSGLAKAFGRRGDKPAANVNRMHDDPEYLKIHERYSDDFLRLQVVLRDVEYYTRQCATYVSDFLRMLSAMELIMRLSPSPYPELESKWARFNMSMRDMGTFVLDRHIDAVKSRVIEPIEKVIATYGPPGLAIKKRNKRRLDFEKHSALKAQGKKISKELTDLVAQYEALNDILKMELPKLSQMTVKIGKICQYHFVTLEAEWYKIWQDKVKVVLEAGQMAHEFPQILDMFNRDFKYQENRAQQLGIVNGTFLALEHNVRSSSQSTVNDAASARSAGRPSNISSRSRGLSITSDQSPSLPTPDFRRNSGSQFTFSPIVATTPGNPLGVYQHNLPYTNGYTRSNMDSQPYNSGHSRNGSGSPAALDVMSASASNPRPNGAPRPSTGRSFTSEIAASTSRLSTEYTSPSRRESSSTYNSGYHIDGPLQNQLLQSSRPYSGIFQSAMPLPDGPDESGRSSRASSRDRNMSHGYNVLYLAASLFEFNISQVKQEAGYPYLTYGAGEIFDVIGEKGELWLAKNQDDPPDNIEVGWIWSKHFARLASD